MNRFCATCAVLGAVFFALAGCAEAASGAEAEFKLYPVTDADPTGQTLSTEAIQRQIDAAAEAAKAGDFTAAVVLRPGTYKITDVQLKDRVHLKVEKDAVLRATDDKADYKRHRPLVWAENARDIGIFGGGTLMGTNTWKYSKDGTPLEASRAGSLTVLTRCRDAVVRDVTMRDNVYWTFILLDCDDVVIQRVTIRNGPWKTHPATDGIDVCHSRNVLIEDCDIETGDDGICLKSGVKLGLKNVKNPKVPEMYNIVARRCRLATTCNAIKIGTDTAGDVRDVLFEDITIAKHSKFIEGNPIPTGECIAAISLQSSDGGAVSNITCRNITIEDCYVPIFAVLQKRAARYLPRLGSLGGLTFENIVCKRSLDASQINVQAGARIDKIVMRNLDMTCIGSRKSEALPRRPDGGYPDAKNYGTMPGYGLFARSVDELVLEGKMRFVDAGGSGRSAVAIEDVKAFSDAKVETGPVNPKIMTPRAGK